MSVETPNALEAGVWHTAEVARNGRLGTLTVDGQQVGEVTASGDMDRLSVVGPLYLGGFPTGGAPIPYQSVTPVKSDKSTPVQSSSAQSSPHQSRTCN